ncbi:MAG: endonuclease/exonuclease/phosphatase family protein, partial [Spirochaetia bacterium]|nr:endonuclease/exonuclease/phosphatase family protein [Spirochaetia bacterium]
MKIISWNVNGIRAVEKKGNIQELIETQGPDILFLQETKARAEQLSEWLVENPDYQQHYHAAQKPGYSGVSVWLRVGIDAEVETGMAGWEDVEGRVISARLGDLLLFGIYFPNGGKSPEAWKEKLRFYDHFHKHIGGLRKKNLRIAFTGDLNVA